MKYKLIDYFKDKQSKYLKLSNGAYIKLEYVDVLEDDLKDSLHLVFTNNYDNLYISFRFGVKNEYPTMVVPQNYYHTPFIKVQSMLSVGSILDSVAKEWVETKDTINLEWSD